MRWTLITARLLSDHKWPGTPLEGDPCFTKWRGKADRYTPWHKAVTHNYFGSELPLRVNARKPIAPDIAGRLESGLNQHPPFDGSDPALHPLDKALLDQIGFCSDHLACLPDIMARLACDNVIIDFTIRDGIEVAVRFLDPQGKTAAIWKNHSLSLHLNPTETLISGMMGRDLGTLIGTPPTGLCVSASRHDGLKLHLNFHMSNKG